MNMQSKKIEIRELTTSLDWCDLELSNESMSDILDVKKQIKLNDSAYAQRRFKKSGSRNFTALFHGPSGTGKTLAASLLGKEIGVRVFRVNTKSIISKFIGETEKNLSKLFAEAQDNNFILFFDEADSLFGKRSSVSDSEKTEFSGKLQNFLLQKFENFNGFAILSITSLTNIDQAMVRRFTHVVRFSTNEHV